MHEDFSRAEEVKGASERSFGLVFAAFFLLVALTPLFHHPHEMVRWWPFGVSVLLAALALFWQSPLKPLNRLWMRLGRLLYHVVSPLTLGLLFYTAVIPVGLLMRLCGKDTLNLRTDLAANTYWIRRDPAGPSPETMKNQF